MEVDLILNRFKKLKKIKSDTDLADFLGVKRPNVPQWRRRNSINLDLIASKCNKEEFIFVMYGEDVDPQNPDPGPCSSKDSSATLPLIPFDAMAGLPSVDNIGVSYADCEQYCVPEFAARGADFLIRVSGSSMYPKYSNGDLLACSLIRDILFFQWGKVYVIDSSQGALVKRIFTSQKEGFITLSSDNKDNYPPFDFPTSDIRALAIVIGVIRIE